ncbi:MAG: type II toxin-antitoxin system RelE/ParE family toxin [Gemmatimonadota bacterium]|nr:type II toxin-antitoxin system RelE/ParE family toxin [Gemmatimonadota bacterium]
MKVEFRNSFERDLRRIRDQAIKERIKTVIEQIEKVNDLTEASNVRKLRGGENHYRVRIGDYRLGLLLNEGTVVFVRCLPRQDIYRYFP